MTIQPQNPSKRDSLLLYIMLAFFSLPAICGGLLAAILAVSSHSYDEGVAAYEQGDIETAIASFNRAASINPLDARTYFLRGDVYYVTGDYVRAIEDYTTAINRGYRPTDLAYAARGNSYAALGEYQLSNPDYTTGAEGFGAGDYYQYLVERANVYSNVIEKNPGLASAYYARGFAGAHSPYLDDTQAVEDLSKAIQMGREPLSEVYITRGLAKISMEDSTGALHDLGFALKLDPNASDAYYYRSGVYIQLKQYQQAFSDLERLADAYPSDAETQNNLCWYGSLLGHAAEVLKACEQAVTLAPDNPDIRDSRGLARALTGDFDGAIADFNYFIENASASSVDISKRESWVSALAQGKIPFDEELLAEMLEASW
jgi:tetratricopeptide (TPR) repeat protein